MILKINQVFKLPSEDTYKSIKTSYFW